MQLFCLRSEGLRIADDAIRKTGSQCNQKVAFGNCQIRSLRSVHADHAGKIRIILIKSADSHQGFADGGIHLSQKCGEFFSRICTDCASSYQKEGLFGLLNERYCLFDILFVIFLGTQKRLRFLLGKFAFQLCDILGNIYHDRPLSTGRGNLKSSSYGRSQLFNVLHNKPMLRNRHGDAGHVHLLEGVLAKQGKIDITGNGNHRNRVHIGGCKTCDKVGRTRAAGRHAYPDFTGGSGITVRRMCSPLLMRSTNMSDFLFMQVKLVINIENGSAGISENRIHLLFFQTFDYNLCAG